MDTIPYKMTPLTSLAPNATALVVRCATCNMTMYGIRALVAPDNRLLCNGCAKEEAEDLPK